jgi:SAM-dependent methyltransferase
MKQKTLSKSELSKLWKIAGGDEKKFKRYAERRLQHEPIAYIRGFATFFGREFKVDRRAYVPNPETENMVKLFLGDLTDGSVVLDVGTGCGSIAITVAKENPKVVVYGSDINPAALKLARQNAELSGININFFESNYVYCLDIEEPTHIIADLPYGITSLPIGKGEHILSTNNVAELMHMPPNAYFHPGGILESYGSLISSIMGKGWRPRLFFETGKVGKPDVEKIIPSGLTWEYIRYENYSVTILDFSNGNGGRRNENRRIRKKI